MKTIFPDKVDFTKKVLNTLFEKHDVMHNGKQSRPEGVEDRKYAFTLFDCLNVLMMGMECFVAGVLYCVDDVFASWIGCVR